MCLWQLQMKLSAEQMSEFKQIRWILISLSAPPSISTLPYMTAALIMSKKTLITSHSHLTLHLPSLHPFLCHSLLLLSFCPSQTFSFSCLISLFSKWSSAPFILSYSPSSSLPHTFSTLSQSLSSSSFLLCLCFLLSTKGFRVRLQSPWQPYWRTSLGNTGLEQLISPRSVLTELRLIILLFDQFWLLSSWHIFYTKHARAQRLC